MISRKEAKIIVEKFLSKQKGYYAVEHILLYSEISRKPSYYFQKSVNVSDCWIAYINDTPPNKPNFILKESTIVVISGITGEILYFGGAGDEG